MNCLRLSLAVFATAVTSVATAAPPDYQAERRDHRIDAVRTPSPITVDGALDENAWHLASIATGFRQAEPREGEPASEQTEVRLLYDDANLYIGVFAHDADAGGIVVNELKKDFDTSGADVFEVVLDTFSDERNGYMFSVNAFGAKWDAQMVNEGRDVNSNWDAIWSVETRIVKGGWYAEIAIPFRTLRFTSADTQSWGINFHRRIRRRNEDSYWSPIPRIFSLARVSLAGTLNGLRGVRPGRDLRIKPYLLTSGTRVAPAPTTGDLQGGIDAKYGVTSGLTWDFTVNTDFSQVEADEQQVNLTRFSLFFPEKRDFFLENSGVFQFGTPIQTGGNNAGGPAGGGRTNGLPENVLFFSRRIGLSDAGEALPILAGTRLTGRAGAYTIGALNMQQRRSDSTPATNFSAVRVRRNVLASSDIGVMLLNKAGGGYNRLAGADANFRFFDNLNVNGFVARTATSSLRAGAGAETMWRGGVAYRGDVLETTGIYTSTGDRFNDELGFIPRVGVNRADFKIGPHLRSRLFGSWIREIYPHYNLVNIARTAGGAFDSRYMDFHLPFNFQNSAFLEIGKNTNVEVLTVPFTLNRARSVVVDPGRYAYDEYFVTGNTDRGRALSVNGRIGTGDFYDGRKQSYLAGAALRVNAKLNTSVTALRNVISLARGAYTTDLIAGRVNYSFSTRAFLNALIQYNTDAREWSSNIRLDIIHHPLSDLFLVYNDHRDTVGGSLKDRSIVAKLTYLLAF